MAQRNQGVFRKICFQENLKRIEELDYKQQIECNADTARYYADARTGEELRAVHYLKMMFGLQH
ncbi:MAG: hypothetical protein KME13_08300 [Myxacorys californica WJT36-NPBG1]|jgi:hypothetical protein|nr:hypothetical protein [Myxacorys californica WJT36-NPBG1]